MEFDGVDPVEYETEGMKHIFTVDHDFVSIQRQIKNEFNDFFGKAIDAYIDGDWINAVSSLNICQTIVPTDGPTKWMLEFLEKNKNMPPDGWKGTRNIDAKMEAPEIHVIDKDQYDLMGEEQDD